MAIIVVIVVVFVSFVVAAVLLSPPSLSSFFCCGCCCCYFLLAGFTYFASAAHCWIELKRCVCTCTRVQASPFHRPTRLTANLKIKGVFLGVFWEIVLCFCKSRIGVGSSHFSCETDLSLGGAGPLSTPSYRNNLENCKKHSTSTK